MKNAKLVHEEYLPHHHHRLHRWCPMRLITKLRTCPAARSSSSSGPVARRPSAIAAQGLKKRFGVIATGGNIPPPWPATRPSPGMEGATYYYFGISEPVNEALVAAHCKEFKARRLLHRRELQLGHGAGHGPQGHQW